METTGRPTGRRSLAVRADEMMIRPPGASPGTAERVRVRLSGAVQGVGMRPFVHRLAAETGLAGFVRNGADGVTIEVEGSRIADFISRLSAETPPLARIDALAIETLAPTGDAGFSIGASTGGRAATRVVPDAATCPDCLAELFDPASRFFGYPFTNCTQCGPRYTITRRLPYDRGRTAMAGFTMCAACAADYADPLNRRFHAEPIACPSCGPRLSHAIRAIAAALRDGRIVALKGIGGFHLLCDARNEAAVAALRRRKSREAKPFAVMVANAASLGTAAQATAAETALASGMARPIVLMRAVPGALAPSVSPGLAHVGVMLAYAPPHHLLFAELAGTAGAGHDPFAPNPAVLVATSANPGGEPLVIDDADAERRLAGVADLIVTHDRPILVRIDDSVTHILAGAPALLRRARGFVPEPIELPADGPDVLALGGHLKSTVTVTRGREAFVSQHIGDLDTAETVKFHRETTAHLLSVLDVTPTRVICDLHPDYRSTRIAEAFDLPCVRVQHHAAHVAAVAGEHGLTGRVLGLALDGHGMGPDGENWGGEMLLLEGAAWRRLGGLFPLPLPGGERAAREPPRMGVAALAALGRAQEIAVRFREFPFARPVAAYLARPGLCPVTSSMGRLFDAASGLLGLCRVQDYEGQAAMELEALVTGPLAMPGGFALDQGVLDFRPLLAA
ncbi:MAG TPA: carbamoyltransferase HypF, partial [Acidisphaera sp.]|nr:carbamoyltransferase HypF [Acidisphaera sp.]